MFRAGRKKSINCRTVVFIDVRIIISKIKTKWERNFVHLNASIFLCQKCSIVQNVDNVFSKRGKTR